VLGLGLQRDPPFRFNGDALDALEDVRDLGGFAFAAHPLSARADLAWTGWDLPGPWGIELVNGDSEARRAGPRLLLTAGQYLLNRRYALARGLGSPDEVLRRWDALLARRDVVGLSGSDAHSRLPLTRRHALRFPSYESLFTLSRNHVLLRERPTGDAARDGAAVLEALAAGRFLIGFDGLAPAGEFAFEVESGGARLAMGETGPFAAGARARAGGRVPAGTRLVLLRDGATLEESVEGLDVALPGPGVYRLEARVPGWAMPWVITNPIFLFDDAAREARRAAAAWPGPPAAKRVVPLATLPGSAAFNPEHDPTSRIEPPVVVGGAGPRGEDALRLAFRLGSPSAAQPFTWCALVNRQERDLRGHAGLRFLVKADGEYRPWLQVRDANRASADEGLEWWLASVRTTTEWREVRLPFSRFRTINPKTDGRLDLDAVRGLVLVLDPAAVKPGTQGTIWIVGLGVYE
jgi:hypothetical protein